MGLKLLSSKTNTKAILELLRISALKARLSFNLRSLEKQKRERYEDTRLSLQNEYMNHYAQITRKVYLIEQVNQLTAHYSEKVPIKKASASLSP